MKITTLADLPAALRAAASLTLFPNTICWNWAMLPLADKKKIADYTDKIDALTAFELAIEAHYARVANNNHLNTP
jgi:hypothetical protein